MNTQIRQIKTMVAVNIGSIHRRIWISLSMIFSITLVVGILIGFLAMAKGFETALNSAGSDKIAVILGGGTNQEAGSDIPQAAIRTLDATRLDIGVVRDVKGNLLRSREIIVPIDYRENSNTHEQTLMLRGMDKTGIELRENTKLFAGRLFTKNSREIVVGAKLAQKYDNFAIGNKVRFGAFEWTVVGHFTANGSAFESEIWTGIDVVRSYFNRIGFVQSLRVRLTNQGDLSVLQASLDKITGAKLIAITEDKLYAAQSEKTSGLIKLFGWPIAILMAFGATAGALNTMMSSVSDRTVEIATIRTLGFSRLSAFIATWLEALILSLVGILIGVGGSWLIFNGWQASTMGANNTQMAFQFNVTSDVMITAALLGLCVGLIGGALPAIAAVRIPLSKALHSTG